MKCTRVGTQIATHKTGMGGREIMIRRDTEVEVLHVTKEEATGIEKALMTAIKGVVVAHLPSTIEI